MGIIALQKDVDVMNFRDYKTNKNRTIVLRDYCIVLRRIFIFITTDRRVSMAILHDSREGSRKYANAHIHICKHVADQ
jgi:hypothetical protein